MAQAIELLIPVYREGEGILKTLRHLEASVQTPFRALICYDLDDDPTLEVIRRNQFRFEIVPVRNRTGGVHNAVMSGFELSHSPAVIVYPADDDVNGVIIDEMARRAEAGADIVAPSRFMKGGCMKGCRFSKAFLVRTAAFLLYHVARVPTHDPTNGFRLFSRRVIREIPVESTDGFAFSIELLVKAQRKGWRIEELPASWFERKHGKSRFKIFRWAPVYLRWFFYAFASAFSAKRTIRSN